MQLDIIQTHQCKFGEEGPGKSYTLTFVVDRVESTNTDLKN